MQRRGLVRNLGLMLIILGVGVGGFIALRAMRASPVLDEHEESFPLVETIPLEASTAEFQIRLNGTVVPKREMTIMAEVAGEIIHKSAVCEAGVYVTAGTTLLDIDPRHYELEIKRLVAEVKQAELDLQQVEVEINNNLALIDIAERELALANQEWERIADLVERKTVPKTDAERAETAALQARNALKQLENAHALLPVRRDRLEAQLQLTNARLESARLDLEKTVVKAPIDGVVSEQLVEARQFVQPGTVLLRIEDTTVAEVRCNLPIEDLYWLWDSVGPRAEETQVTGKPFYEVPEVNATVTFDLGERAYQWEGHLSRYEGIGIDEQTRTVPCRVEVPEPRRPDATEGPPALVRGMFVTIDLRAAPQLPLLRVPSRAVQPNGEIWTVADGQLRVHRVRPAKVLTDHVLVRAESTRLAVGDRLVVTPLATAFDGMQVRESAPQ